MKSFFRNIAAFSLAFLVVFASSSFSLIKHFCGDEIVSVSIFENIASCCDQQIQDEVPTLSKISCCSSTKDFKLATELEKSEKNTKIEPITVAVFLSIIEWEVDLHHYYTLKAMEDPSPPDSKLGRHLLYETLLI
ncbi:MAG: hypothetical protein OIF50_05250 [Flavobacteriaceae bacterium]|nr:hypothetical protein [Flavobacteriaceae bacterium]